MQRHTQKLILGMVAAIAAGTPAQAMLKNARWTASDDARPQLSAILERVQATTGIALSEADLSITEERDLATSHFTTYAQLAEGLPMRGRNLRVWTTRDGTSVIQVEAALETADEVSKLRQKRARKGFSLQSILSSIGKDQTLALVRKAVRTSGGTDTLVRDVSWDDAWENGQVVRLVTAKGRRGTHKVALAIDRKKVLRVDYEEFPQFEGNGSQVSTQNTAEEFSIAATVYPIYEQADDVATVQARVPAELKYLKRTIPEISGDPYLDLRSRRYLESQYDPILGSTDAGRKLGYWSMASVKEQAASILANLPRKENQYANGGVILDGRYATVSFHPGAFSMMPFNPMLSAQFKPDWRASFVDGSEVWEMIPLGSFLGKPVMSEEDALTRPARRLPDHDPRGYIADGFDELQVYYAINTLMDSLHTHGFTDPELSTRPFNAFLYDPDISMRNNAYYTDDTINFTTYSPDAPNYARDNSTIWHELGHGIMDRLMGDQIQLADTGGLSEGMADFLAALVVADVTRGVPFEGSQSFRIINKTGFFLTNEVHDDGEAYGGAMKDLLDAAIARDGQIGVKKVTDLTLEAMRLCRNHPGLTAQEWFNHMLFADERGTEGVRTSGEMRSLILAALAGRNFDLAGESQAGFALRQNGSDVDGFGPGSRRRPITAMLNADVTLTTAMEAQLRSSRDYAFHYPVKVQVVLRGGPIQGAIHWEGEEAGALEYTIANEAELLKLPLTVRGTCDYANRDDGSCVDYASFRVFNSNGAGGWEAQPVAKKRFYLRVVTQQPRPAEPDTSQ